MKRLTQSILALMITAAFCQMAGAQTSTAPANNDAVYQAFGGKAGIGKVIDDFLVIWQADPRINTVLQDADVERLGELLKEQFSQLTGGPAVYSGKDMKTVHEDLGLRNADFNALTEDLQKSMDKNNVPWRAQNKLLNKLAPMEHDIVTK